MGDIALGVSDEYAVIDAVENQSVHVQLFLQGDGSVGDSLSTEIYVNSGADIGFFALFHEDLHLLRLWRSAPFIPHCSGSL